MKIPVKMVAMDEKYKPTYAHDTDFCMDLKVRVYDRAVDTGSEIKRVPSDYEIIAPGESKIFGTGLQVSIPEEWGLFVVPRSSTGFRLNCRLVNTIGVIDTDYRDELKVKLHNFGTEPVVIEDAQRICQIYILPKYTIEPIYVEDDEAFRVGDRGGGIGSTGV